MAISIDALSESDLKRFAACWLSCDRTTVDWTAAAAAYDTNAKWESFRTVTSKAANKNLKGDGGGEGGVTTPKPKKAAAGKRKKTTSEAGADDEGAPMPKKGKAGRPKKVKSGEKVASEAEDADKGREEGEASE